MDNTKRIATVAASLSLVLLTALFNQAMADDFDIEKWEGNYRGFIDGRPASLRIEFVTHIGTPLPRGCIDVVKEYKRVIKNGKAGKNELHAFIYVVLRDLNRDTVLSRCLDRFGGDAPKDHRWKNLELLNHKTEEKDNVGTLYLHTWDTDVISGWSEWNGKRYGRMFIKANRSLPACEKFPTLGFIHGGGVPVLPEREPDCEF